MRISWVLVHTVCISASAPPASARTKLLNPHHTNHAGIEGASTNQLVGIEGVAASLIKHIEGLLRSHSVDPVTTSGTKTSGKAASEVFLATGTDAIKQWASHWRAYNSSLPIPITYLTDTYRGSLLRSDVGVGGSNLPPFPFLQESMPASFRAQRTWTPQDIFPLASTAAHFDLPLIVLGYGKKWKGFNDKIEGVSV